ncbi:MAG: SUMF1/EgtB/PvdO family nonheme iron enzyme [Gammaproteobacteria bacterium]
MDANHQKLFASLLLSLSGWNSERDRTTLISQALGSSHPVLGKLRLDGSGENVAAELVGLCGQAESLETEGGLSPCCAVLAAIRERGYASAGPNRENLNKLEQALACAGKQRRQWSGCPYPGLLAFDHTQAPIYFGREKETRALLDMLAGPMGHRFIIVAGASGSGKSSLVRAGVWATLAEGLAPDIPGSEHWVISAMTPAAGGGAPNPFLAMARGLEDAPRIARRYAEDDARVFEHDPDAFPGVLDNLLEGQGEGAEWLLVLDQMEEIFSTALDEHRSRFLDFLLTAVENPRFRVIATVRSEFLDACIRHKGLQSILNPPRNGMYTVREPEENALLRMVSGPVEEVDLTPQMKLDPLLVLSIVRAAEDEPGGLALMAFALRELYDRCLAAGRMDLATFDEEDSRGLKGLASVMVRRAGSALAELGEGSDAARAWPRVFSRLVNVPDRDHPPTRRREALAFWADDAPARAFIDAFAKARLLVIGGTRDEGGARVDVAHETLLVTWPLLVQWIDAHGEALTLRDQLIREARAWVANGRRDHDRWRHERLAPARKLLADHELLAETERDPDAGDFLITEADWLLARLCCRTTDHGVREEIGLRLSEIGDPRPGVGLRDDGLPDILWRAVPGGEVTIEDHGPRRVAPFHLAAYPVTHAQFEAFIDAPDGYASERWWDGLRRKLLVRRRIRRRGNLPATEVDWYEAMAFCAWLSHHLGYTIRLPKEAEWQWAAQSAQKGFVYPWGEGWEADRANTSQAGLGHSLAVGLYPKGSSRQGIHDLAGNVWEWCWNTYEDPDQYAPEINGVRVQRGGSWRCYRSDACAAHRSNFLPGERFDYFGFRVVCSYPMF